MHKSYNMTEKKIIPVTVYAEMTPNPSTMKFVANKIIIADGDTAEYLTYESTVGSSPLAEELFKFPFVTGVFIARNFVTITKNERIKWEFVNSEIRAFITNYLSTHEQAVIKLPEPIESEDSGEKAVNSEPIINTPTDQQIVDLLDEYVRPAVEGDGGAIDFQSYNEESGVVTVVLKGACSGCPSSSATLKGGIENLLKSHIPSVKDVVALEM